MLPGPVEELLLLVTRRPFASLLLLCAAWAVASRLPAVRTAAPGWRRDLRPVLATASTLTLLAFASFGIWYCEQPGFACEVEPQVATVSSMMNDGAAVYHPLEAAERYSILYGPSVYLTTGAVMKVFGASIPAAKSGATAALLLSLVLLAAALARNMALGHTLVLTALAAMLYWTQGTSAFVLRPDPFLILSVSAGLWTAGLGRRSAATLLTAAAFAFTVNLKIHAGLYLLPVLTLLHLRHGTRAVLIAVAGGLAGAMAPFAFHPGLDPYLYAGWIRLSLEHGLDPAQVQPLLHRVLFYSLPVMIPLLARGRNAPEARETRQLLLVWAVANASVLVLATKPGAGLVHLLPLIPVNIVFGARLWSTLPNHGTTAGRFRVSIRGPAAAFLFVAAILSSVTGYRAGRQAEWLMSDSAAQAADIHAILADNSGRTIGMGYGGEGEAFLATFLRPLLAFAHQPVTLDVISQMDASRAGLELTAGSLAALDAGVIDLWLVPKGQAPFDKHNWYPPFHPIFSERFRERFLANYRLVSTTQYYDLWTWAGARHALGGAAP